MHRTKNMNTRVIHLSTSIARSSFGLGSAAINLASFQLHQGIDSEIWTLDSAEESADQPELSNYPRERISHFRKLKPKSLGLSPQLILYTALRSQRPSTVLHQHGIWTATSSATALWSVFKKLPAIVAPHGSLDNYALKYSKGKKAIARVLYEDTNLRHAQCLHALSIVEADSMREYGLKNPIAVIPNGVLDINPIRRKDDKSFRRRYSISQDKKILLFLSRITPKKGIPTLLDSILSVKSQFSEWILVLVGPTDGDHLKMLENRVCEHGLQDFVRFVGPLFGDEKYNAYSSADAFILPSHSEGFPLAVLEAMISRLPVIVTTATPLDQTEVETAGWRVSDSEASLSFALKQLLETPRDKLIEMGECGRRIVLNKFTWELAAARLQLVYNWMLGLSPKPEYVQPAL